MSIYISMRKSMPVHSQCDVINSRTEQAPAPHPANPHHTQADVLGLHVRDIPDTLLQPLPLKSSLRIAPSSPSPGAIGAPYATHHVSPQLPTTKLSLNRNWATQTSPSQGDLYTHVKYTPQSPPRMHKASLQSHADVAMSTADLQRLALQLPKTTARGPPPKTRGKTSLPKQMGVTRNRPGWGGG